MIFLLGGGVQGEDEKSEYVKAGPADPDRLICSVTLHRFTLS